MFKIEDGYKISIKRLKQGNYLVPQKKLIDKTKNGENITSLELVELVLVQCNLVDKQYQQKFEVLYTFTPNKSYGYLLNVEPSNLVFFKTYNT